MSITCQVCGTANPDGTTYCEGCGVELTGSAAPAEATAEATTPNPVAPDTAPEVLVAAAAPAEPVVPSEAMPSAEVAPSPEAEAIPASSEPVVTDWDATSSDMPAPEASAPEMAAAEAPALETAEPASTEPEAAPAEVTPVAAAPVAAPATSGGEAKLGIKKFGAATGESIPLQGERLVVGRFDASSGPVDIDLSGMGGQEHISRRHAELYREGGVWYVRDLGSTNGVYIKRNGESAFSPRLQEPAALADGDELAFGNLMFTFQQG